MYITPLDADTYSVQVKSSISLPNAMFFVFGEINDQVRVAYLLLVVMIGNISMKTMEMSHFAKSETLTHFQVLDNLKSPVTAELSEVLVQDQVSAKQESRESNVTFQLIERSRDNSNETNQNSENAARISGNPIVKSAWTSNVMGSSSSSSNSAVENFVHHPKVAIVMKIHGMAFLPEVKQSLCLLDVAYNNRVLYDIIIFHTIPIDESDKAAVQEIVHPANLTFVMDEKTLEQQIAEMTPLQQQVLVERCQNVSTTDDIRWHTSCRDGKHVMPIAYCWMSEFRAKEIWLQTALQPYKYMLWWDSDNYATMVWKQDPIEYMIREDLVILMAHYAQGSTKGDTGIQQKLLQVYNRTLCAARVMENGRLHADYGNARNCADTSVKQVHGFFHITNLDFYRLPQNLHWYDVEIGDNKFSRVWDDQLAVAIPAVMLAPERAAEMEMVGISPEIMHNGITMGKRKWRGGAYKAFWKSEGPTKFPEARTKCSEFITISM
jgi:hypothetical protein